MINFFKNIFNTNNQKNIFKEQNDVTKIYFDRSKKNFLELKILNDYCCQDIHCNYHNEILAELIRNNHTSGSNSSLNKIINQNEFAFMIIDDENPFTEIKLKMKDYPCKFLKKRCINLYYLNVGSSKKEENLETKTVIDVMDTYSVNSQSSMMQGGSTNQGECIREGELMKYSIKHKKFDKRIVVLDREKLIITKPRNKESTILLLSDISTINREISEKTAKEKFTFEITTFESDHYIFKAKHNADMESWMDSISNYFSLIRDNKFIIKYGEQINRLVKDSYEKGMKIIYNCLSLKGIVSINETREVLLKMYGDKTIGSILESVISYRNNLRYYRYIEAWKNFENIFELLDIDNFDINNYFQPIHNPNANLNLDDDINLGCSTAINRRQTNESMGSAEYDDKKSTSSNKASPYSRPSFSNRKGSNPDKMIKERKVLLENTKVSSREKESVLRKDSISKNLRGDFEEANSEENEDVKNNEGTSYFETPVLKPKRELRGKFKSTLGIVKLSPSLLNISQESRTKLVLIKHLISFENLKYLKNLKSEIKELIDNFKNDNSHTNEFNTKLNEILKSNIFIEIYDNILTKYLQNFYKSINTNQDFISRIENILLYYYKTKNNITQHQLINLVNFLPNNNNTYKTLNSVSEIKLSHPSVEEKGFYYNFSSSTNDLSPDKLKK